MKNATEVSSDNSALMRNIRRHEHALEGAIAGRCRAVMAASRSLGAKPAEEGDCASPTMTASSPTRARRSSRTWPRWPPGSWRRGSTAPSGTARMRQPPAGPPQGLPSTCHPPPDSAAGARRRAGVTAGMRVWCLSRPCGGGGRGRAHREGNGGCKPARPEP